MRQAQARKSFDAYLHAPKRSERPHLHVVMDPDLIRPDGNQFLFSRQKNGTLTNSSVPWLQGAVMTTTADGASLRYPNGTVYQFQPLDLISYLSSFLNHLTFHTPFFEEPTKDCCTGRHTIHLINCIGNFLKEKRRVMREKVEDILKLKLVIFTRKQTDRD